ncbi:hypothetical protein ACEPAF_9273 [Sanghuangporus sanghuang]
MLSHSAISPELTQLGSTSNKVEDARNEARSRTPPNTRPIPCSTTSPAKVHSTLEGGFLSGGLDDMRESNLKDVDYTFVEIDKESFINNLLPPLKNDVDIESVFETLKNKGLITEEQNDHADTRLTWVLKDFQVEPKSAEDTENTVFAALCIIADEVVQATKGSLGVDPTVVLRARPDNPPKSHRGSTIRPDAYNILVQAEKEAQRAEAELQHQKEMEHKRRVRTTDKSQQGLGEKSNQEKSKIKLPRWWHDLAFTWEFKKGDGLSDRDANVSQIVFNIERTLALDPCRRFTFGITIENKTMRLWFCSRAVPLVSEGFDFTKEIKLLIQILLSFAYASKEELGWDQSITPFINGDGDRAYNFEVGEELFETEEMLQDFAADALNSRGSRLWIVKNKRTLQRGVLKDLWIEDDRDPEHVIYENILHDIEAKYGQDARSEAEPHVLTPVAHCFVRADGQEDHTTRVIMRGYAPQFKKGFNLKAHAPSTKNNMTKGNRPPAASDSVAPARGKRKPKDRFPLHARRKQLHHRKHYRIVFKEVGYGLHTIRCLSDAFVVLRDSAKVLYWIHGCGWLHRDISVGNLYWYDGRGLIGDFEYAKHRDSPVSHEVRSCSPEFSANEVLKNMFIHLTEPDITTDLPFGIEKLTNVLPFFHNGLHNLESLWWVAVWLLFFNRDGSVENDQNSDEDGEEDEEDENDQDDLRESLIQKLFPCGIITEERGRFLQYTTDYLKSIQWMAGKFSLVAFKLNHLRAALISKYIDFEATFPKKSWGMLEGMQYVFLQHFEECRKQAIGIKLVPHKSTGAHVDVDEQEQTQAELAGGFGNVHLSDDDGDIQDITGDDRCSMRPIQLHLER